MPAAGLAARHLPGAPFVAVLKALEREGVPYCLLRDLPEEVPEGKDLDVLVADEDWQAAVGVLATEGFLPLRRTPRVYGKCKYTRYREGMAHLLDLHRFVSAQGLVYMDARQALSRRERRDGYYVLSDEDRLIHLALHARVTKGRLARRDADRLRVLAEARLPSPYVDRAVRRFGMAHELASALAAARVGAETAWPDAQRRRSGLKLVACAPVNALRLIARTAHQLRRRLAGDRRAGLLVALVGPDGAGKSTTIAALVARAGRAGLGRVDAAYLGPWGQHRLGLVPWVRRAGLTPSLDPWGAWLRERWLGRAAAGAGTPAASLGAAALVTRWAGATVKATVFYAAIWLELMFRYLTLVRPKLRRGHVVLADRYVSDLRYLYKGDPIPGHRLLRRLVCRLFPRPDLYVQLEDDPERVHARKPQLSVDRLRVAQRLLARAVERAPSVSVRTDREPEQVADEVLVRIIERAARRTG